MNTKDLDLVTPDGPMTAHLARPDREPAGAIIVIPEAFGLNNHIRDVTDRCATAGYVGVGLDIFHRYGGPNPATVPYDNAAQVMRLFENMTDGGLLADVDAATGYLSSVGIGSSRTGIVGFCFGGRIAFLVALRRAIGAAVSFYGGGIVAQRGPLTSFPALIDATSDLRTPWLGLFGDRDKSIPVDEVETLRTTLDAVTSLDHGILRYPEAEHGFHCDARPSFNADAAADAWQRTLDWFSRHFS